ncbi:MAG: hypothetical protein ACO1SX_00220 [Actinomycetota bacterium]
MGTVVPYSWVNTKQVLAGTSPPATGLWWRDFDNVDDTGGNSAWFPVPLWTALDFAYLDGGQLLVLVAGPHDLGLRSVLRVYRFSGSPDAQTSLGYAELESSEVSGAALGIRAGIVEVFYTQNQILKRKESRDGGETFGSADTYSLASSGAAAFTPSQSEWAVGDGQMEASARGGFVAFDYLPGGSLAMVLAGRLAGAGSDDNHLVKANRDGSGWSFGSIAKIDASSTLNLVTCIQTLRVGDPLLGTWGKRVTKLTDAGTFTLVNGVAYQFRNLSWFDEPTNQMLIMEHKAASGQDAGGRYSWFSTKSERFTPSTSTWVLGGESSFDAGEWLEGWLTVQTNGPIITRFKSSAGKVRRRGDGRWEFLYLNRDEQPELVRAAKAPMAGVGTSWV